jgi:hypothetical protein
MPKPQPKGFAVPKLAPPAMPPRRVAEARQIASDGRWFVNCPEARCRAEGRCHGRLRRFHPGGPRCYPTCFKVALEALFAGHDRTDEQDDQLEAILAHDEGYWATIEGRGNGEASHSAILLMFLHVLAVPIGEGATALA